MEVTIALMSSYVIDTLLSQETTPMLDLEIERQRNWLWGVLRAAIACSESLVAGPTTSRKQHVACSIDDLPAKSYTVGIGA